MLITGGSDVEQVANENLANRKRRVQKFAARDVLQTPQAPPAHPRGPPAEGPTRPKAQARPGPGQISGNLEIWNLEIWEFGIQ